MLIFLGLILFFSQNSIAARHSPPCVLWSIIISPPGTICFHNNSNPKAEGSYAEVSMYTSLQKSVSGLFKEVLLLINFFKVKRG